MIQEPSHTKLLDSKLPEEHTEASKRLKPPKGSIPASGCPTRGAGGEPDAVTNSDTASPLPDQGWVAPVMAVRDQMLREAAAHRKTAEIESNPITFMERRRHYEGAAAGLVAYASMLEEAVGVIRTQSEAYGDEPESPGSGLMDFCAKTWRETAEIFEQEAGDLGDIQSITNRGFAAGMKSCADTLLMAAKKMQVSRKERSVSGNGGLSHGDESTR